ncbi:MAG: TolC family protein [Flavobacteriales bacterium]|nr:TolC family protein [Flavobacteriales bacterium]
MKAIVFIAFFANLLAFGQNEWSLQACIDTALAHNRSVQISQLNLQQAQQADRSSIYSFFPNLNAGASHGYNWGQTIDPFTNEFANSRVQYDNFYLNSSLTLFSGLQNYYGRKMTDVELEYQKLNHQLSQRNCQLEVTTLYLQAMLNGEIVKVSQQHLKWSEEEVERTSLLFDEGRLTQADVLKVNTQLKKDHQLFIQAQNDYNYSLLLLQQLLGVEYDSSFVIQADEELNLGSKSMEKVAGIEEEMQLLQSEKSLLQSKQIKGQLYPSIILSASMGSGYSENNKIQNSSGEWISKPLGNQLNENFYQSLSASLTIPLFNGNRVRNQININQLEQQRILLENETVIQNRENRRAQLEMDVSNAVSSVEASQQLYEFSKLEYESNHLRYQEGQISFFQLITSKNDLFKAHSSWIQSKYQLKFSQMILSLFLA